MRSLLAIGLIALAGCRTPGPRRIDASGDEAVTSMGLDYADFVEVAEDLAGKLVHGESFLNRAPYVDHYPIKMVLSDIDNRTDIRGLPTNQITGRVRSAGLNSGKIRFVSSFGGGERDSVVEGAQDVAADPRFQQQQVPKQGSLTFPEMSLRTVIDFFHSTDGTSRQSTYVVHMFVSDIASGEIYWEEFSKPIAKAIGRRNVGS